MRLVALLVGLLVTVGVTIALIMALQGTTADPRAPLPKDLPGIGPIVSTVLDGGVTPRVPPVVGAARDEGCSLDRQTLETAVGVYTATQGRAPASEADMVSAGVLREPSALHDVVNGAVVSADPRCP